MKPRSTGTGSRGWRKPLVFVCGAEHPTTMALAGRRRERLGARHQERSRAVSQIEAGRTPGGLGDARRLSFVPGDAGNGAPALMKPITAFRCLRHLSRSQLDATAAGRKPPKTDYDMPPIVCQPARRVHDPAISAQKQIPPIASNRPPPITKARGPRDAMASERSPISGASKETVHLSARAQP